MGKIDSLRHQIDSLMRKYPGFRPDAKQKTIIKEYHRLYKKFSRKYESTWDEPEFTDISFKKRLNAEDETYNVKFKRFRYSQNRPGRENKNYVDVLPKAIYNYLEKVIYKNSRIMEFKKEDLIQLHSFRILKTLALAGLNVNLVDVDEEIEIKNGILKIRGEYYSLNTGLGKELEKKFKARKKEIVKEAEKKIKREEEKRKEAEKIKKEREKMKIDFEREFKEEKAQEDAERKKELEDMRKKNEELRKKEEKIRRKKMEQEEKDRNTEFGKKADNEIKANDKREKSKNLEYERSEELRQKEQKKNEKKRYERDLRKRKKELIYAERKKIEDKKDTLKKELEKMNKELEELRKKEKEIEKNERKKEIEEEQKKIAKEYKKKADSEISSEGKRAKKQVKVDERDEDKRQNKQDTAEKKRYERDLRERKKELIYAERKKIEDKIDTQKKDLKKMNKELEELRKKEKEIEKKEADERRKELEIEEKKQDEKRRKETEETMKTEEEKENSQFEAREKEKARKLRQQAIAEEKRLAAIEREEEKAVEKDIQEAEKKRKAEIRKKLLGMGLLAIPLTKILSEGIPNPSKDQKKSLSIGTKKEKITGSSSTSRQPISIPLDEILPPKPQKPKKKVEKKEEKATSKPTSKPAPKPKIRKEEPKKSKPTQKPGKEKLEILGTRLHQSEKERQKARAIEFLTQKTEIAKLLRVFFNDEEIEELNKALKQTVDAEYKNKNFVYEKYSKLALKYLLKLAKPLNDIATANFRFAHLKHIEFARSLLYAMEIDNKNSGRQHFFALKSIKSTHFKKFLQTTSPEYNRYYNNVTNFISEHREINLLINELIKPSVLSDITGVKKPHISFKYYYNFRTKNKSPHLIRLDDNNNPDNPFTITILAPSLEKMIQEIQTTVKKIQNLRKIKKSFSKIFTGGSRIIPPSQSNIDEGIITGDIYSGKTKYTFDFHINTNLGRITKVRQISPKRSKLFDLKKIDPRIAARIRSIHALMPKDALIELKAIFKAL